MKRLLKFWRVPSADRILLCKALVLVCAVRLGLWVIGFPTLRRWLAGFTRTDTNWAPRQGVDTSTIIWAVQTVSRCVPGATCLTQALATKVLLERLGQPATLRIGVAKGARGQIEAHAR